MGTSVLVTVETDLVLESARSLVELSAFLFFIEDPTFIFEEPPSWLLGLTLATLGLVSVAMPLSIYQSLTLPLLISPINESILHLLVRCFKGSV
uniref:Uncharacterized protein n=1 Tax=Rhizophora mucronata TaxID=61149 RepID=A0A2P2K0D8_RHIMU